jgi:hypothetical protein
VIAAARSSGASKDTLLTNVMLYWITGAISILLALARRQNRGR